ncbi:MAG: DUF3826 domain-containing protein [Opitutaceae bacterium]|nr:DUF3826 domain-containing protein [Opitutaceae bacterium]
MKPILPIAVLGASLILFVVVSLTRADDAAAPAAVPDDYASVAAGRAARIVAALALADTTQSERVTRIVAEQYAKLHAIHEARDASLAAVKADAEVLARTLATEPAKKTAEVDAEAARRRILDETTARLYDLHAEYLARLAVELTPAQVDQVKDGMTYGVLPNTWRGYQEMLPQMTDEQRRQVLAWLIEAREHAMDGSTSEEKHGWFGKYKGRITNYLAAAGYDLKAAEKVWLDSKKK